MSYNSSWTQSWLQPKPLPVARMKTHERPYDALRLLRQIWTHCGTCGVVCCLLVRSFLTVFLCLSVCCYLFYLCVASVCVCVCVSRHEAAIASDAATAARSAADRLQIEKVHISFCVVIILRNLFWFLPFSLSLFVSLCAISHFFASL